MGWLYITRRRFSKDSVDLEQSVSKPKFPAVGRGVGSIAL